MCAPAPELDVVAAREVELPVVEPPRHVDVHAPDAVVVVRRQVGEGGNEAADARCPTESVRYRPTPPLELARPFGMPAGARVEQEPGRLAGAGGERPRSAPARDGPGRWRCPCRRRRSRGPRRRSSPRGPWPRSRSSACPVASAGGSRTDGVEKFEWVEQPRPHWLQ